ncbi:MAG: class I SAM-dependent methyltransferase [Magnetococcus sp. YQC-5]
MRREEYLIHSELEDVHWWFCGRREIIFSLLKKAYGNLQHATLLEIGCGTGGNLRFFAPFCARVTGTDTSPLAIELARKKTKAELILGDFRDLLAHRSHEFDVILLLDVLEHIEDDASFLNDLVRLMAPGARLVVTVPTHAFLWSDHDVALGHQRRYAPKALSDLFANTSLHVYFTSPFNTLLFPPIALMRTMQRLFPGAEKPISSDLNQPPFLLNQLLRGILGMEKYWMRVFRLPFGVSHVIIAQKPAS